MIAPSIIENVYEIKIKQFTNGDYEWFVDKNAMPDSRTWTSDKYYWLPLSRDEMNKAPQLQQNPGY
jgi:starch-binding outer membrane protein, SusD/RagB family